MGTSSYYRFRNVRTLENTESFAPGYSFGCAYVQAGTAPRADRTETMWVFGRGANTTRIGAWSGAWSSTDLVTWKQGRGAQLEGFGHTANVRIGTGLPA